MTELIKQIEQLKNHLFQLQPLSAENQRRLDKKLRLEWNYNSNHIEGNTLTYGETELLLIFDQTKGNHEFREYEEMKGHDVALGLTIELAADKERTITESFIRNINQVLLKTPFYKEAITQDGQPTRRLITVGEYKSMPNSVRLQNGEMFHYASPQETPALMHDLLTWYFSASDDVSKHPIEIAAELHYRFVRIHPFDDGNGRISRLLMNYHLIKHDFPPVIIKSADKKNYLFALHEADSGNMAAFYQYIGEQLIWSLGISIKAAKGEVIDEPGDWNKKAEVLSQQFKVDKKIQKAKSKSSINEVLTKEISPLLEKVIAPSFSLNNLFLSSLIKVYTDVTEVGQIQNLESLHQIFNSKLIMNDDEPDISKLELYYYLIDFNNNGTESFSIVKFIEVRFDQFSYRLSLRKYEFINGENMNTEIFEKYYHQKVTNDDTNIFLNILANEIINEISVKTNATL